MGNYEQRLFKDVINTYCYKIEDSSFIEIVHDLSSSYSFNAALLGLLFV